MLPAKKSRTRRRPRKAQPAAAPDRRQEAGNVPPRLRAGAPAPSLEQRQRRVQQLLLPPTPAAAYASWSGQRTAKAFVLKSFTEANVRTSLLSGLWATTAVVGDLLNDAFEAAGQNVLLLFAVCASRHFCGAAVMGGPCATSVTEGMWERPGKWGAELPVRWLAVGDLPNHVVRRVQGELAYPGGGVEDVCTVRNGSEVPLPVAQRVFEAMLMSENVQTSMLDELPPPPLSSPAPSPPVAALHVQDGDRS